MKEKELEIIKDIAKKAPDAYYDSIEAQALEHNLSKGHMLLAMKRGLDAMVDAHHAMVDAHLSTMDKRNRQAFSDNLLKSIHKYKDL